MYTLESLPLIHVWLDAEQLASTAQILMDGYKLPAIGVVDANHQILGWVTPLQLVGSKPDAKLGDIMVPVPTVLNSNLTVREAAGELLKYECDFLPVQQNGRYEAVVTARGLLGKLRESFDPMTDLPWSDALREWGTSKLQQNVEIAILFIDLNHFGQFNKQYGHVIGDRVIQKVASHLKSKVDPSQDILVRYGGDEFAVGTVRHRDDAETLMTSMLGDGEGLMVDGIDTPVTFTIGIYGGLRTKARNNVHGPSNLDNLVNLASKDCLARKAGYNHAVVESEPEREVVSTQNEKASEPDAEAITFQPSVSEVPTVEVDTPEAVPVEPQAPEVAGETSDSVTAPVAEVENTAAPAGGDSQTVIETIQADDEPGSLTYVVIKSSGRLAVGVSPKMGHSRSESIAIATGKALEKAFADSRVTIDSINVERAGSTELVTARVRAVRDGMERDVTAQAEANGDLDETIGLVVISAFLAE